MFLYLFKTSSCSQFDCEGEQRQQHEKKGPNTQTKTQRRKRKDESFGKSNFDVCSVLWSLHEANTSRKNTVNRVDKKGKLSLSFLHCGPFSTFPSLVTLFGALALTSLANSTRKKERSIKVESTERRKFSLVLWVISRFLWVFRCFSSETHFFRLFLYTFFPVVLSLFICFFAPFISVVPHRWTCFDDKHLFLFLVTQPIFYVRAKAFICFLIRIMRSNLHQWFVRFVSGNVQRFLSRCRSIFLLFARTHTFIPSVRMWAPTKLNQIQRIIEWRPLNCFLLAHIEPNRTEPRQHAANKIFHIFYSSIYLRWWMSTVLSPFTNNFILFNILIHNLMEFSATSFTLFSFVSNVVLCWHIGKKLISDRYLCEITSIQAKCMRINLHCASVCTITPLIRWAKFKMKR